MKLLNLGLYLGVGAGEREPGGILIIGIEA